MNQEPTDNSNNTIPPTTGDSENSVATVLSFISKHFRMIGIVLVGIIMLKLVFGTSSETAYSKRESGTASNAENLIEQSKEMVKAEQLTKLPSIQGDFQAAVEFLKDIFSKKGYDTTAFKLTDVYTYYITPAQEANGLQAAKRFAVRFAIKRKEDTEWHDLTSMRENENMILYQYISGILTETKDFLLDITVWNGKRVINFTDTNIMGKIQRGLEYHKTKGFK
mgnify:CR=1 FL=1